VLRQGSLFTQERRRLGTRAAVVRALLAAGGAESAAAALTQVVLGAGSAAAGADVREGRGRGGAARGAGAGAGLAEEVAMRSEAVKVRPSQHCHFVILSLARIERRRATACAQRLERRRARCFTSPCFL